MRFVHALLIFSALFVATATGLSVAQAQVENDKKSVNEILDLLRGPPQDQVNRVLDEELKEFLKKEPIGPSTLARYIKLNAAAELVRDTSPSTRKVTIRFTGVASILDLELHEEHFASLYMTHFNDKWTVVSKDCSWDTTNVTKLAPQQERLNRLLHSIILKLDTSG